MNNRSSVSLANFARKVIREETWSTASSLLYPLAPKKDSHGTHESKLNQSVHPKKFPNITIAQVQIVGMIIYVSTMHSSYPVEV